MVWAMKRKRHIETQEVHKWKACLNVHGGQQEYGVNHCDTYTPIVNWNTLCLLFIQSIINRWYNKQMDFILAYLHAPAEVPLYMHFPQGCIFKNGVMKEQHILKLTKTIIENDAKSLSRPLAWFL